MAFGFPAYHEEELDLPIPVTHDWIVHACVTVGFAVPAGYRAEPRGMTWRTGSDVSLASWGEEIAITALAPQRLLVRSQCMLPTQCLDWGKNKKNVHRFIDALQKEQSRMASKEPFR